MPRLRLPQQWRIFLLVWDKQMQHKEHLHNTGQPDDEGRGRGFES